MSTSTHLAHSLGSAAQHAPRPLLDATQLALNLASDLSYAGAQKRGERLAQQMRREGSLTANSPRKVIRLPR